MCLISFNSYSQINFTIENVSVNNVPQPDCSSINLGTNNSVTIEYRLRISKPTDLNVGVNRRVVVYIQRTSTSNPEVFQELTISNNSFQNNGIVWQQNFSNTLNASSIEVNGSILYGVFEIPSTVQSNQPKTCNHPLTKAPPPSFALLPTSASLPCGNTDARTFTVTPSNVPSGANVTYNWSHNGWSLISSTNNSRTLQPNSGTSLPLNVSVTPYINGVAQQTQTSTISRGPFTPSVSITGSNNLCTTGNYSVNTSGTGITVTGWSISDPSIATLTINGNQATLSPNGNGQVTLVATLVNACGQSENIPKNVFVGYPLATGNTLIWTGTRGVNPVSTIPDATYQFHVDEVPGATSYTWVLPQGFSVLWGGSTTTTSTSIYITTSATPGTYNMYCKANNDCGSSWTNSFIINNGTGGGGNDCPPGVSPPCAPGGPHPLSIYPNPAFETLTIEPSNNATKGEKAGAAQMKRYSYTLYDFNGNTVQQGNFTGKTTLDVSKLKKGRYILKTKTEDNEEDFHHIVIN